MSATCPCHGISLNRLPRDHEPVRSGDLIYDWFHPGGRFAMPPLGGYQAEASREDMLALPCETCGAGPGAECDGSRYSFFLLPVFVRNAGRFHTRRYIAALHGDKAA